MAFPICRDHPHLPALPEPRWTVEATAEGARVIYTDTPGAVLRYISRVQDPTTWSPLFRLALSYQLAAMLAGPIIKGTEGAKVAGEMLRQAALYRALAIEADANQGDEVPAHLPAWLASR